MTTEQCKTEIRKFATKKDLEPFWEEIVDKTLGAPKPLTQSWDAGKALEFFILRVFELEGADIRWPYTNELFDTVVEELDGTIHIKEYGLSVVVQCKDYTDKKANIEPIAKLRNQLLRRPSDSLGAVFSISGFTRPSVMLAHFVSPLNILLWEQAHIEHCLKSLKPNSFSNAMYSKYKKAVEEGFPNFDVRLDPNI